MNKLFYTLLFIFPSLILFSCNNKVERHTITERVHEDNIDPETKQQIDIINRSAVEVGIKMATLKKLQAGWGKSTNKMDFIINNQKDFETLNLAMTIDNIERALVTNPEALIISIKLRAKANAAFELAAEKYASAYILEEMAELEE